MSLLAGEGIGVFSGDHFVVDRTGQTVPVGGRRGTHNATSLMVEHWAMLQKSVDVVGQVIAPYSIPIAEWIQQFGIAGSLYAVAMRWLREWGLDLHRLAEDHESRNEASYRPTTLIATTEPEPRRCLQFLGEIWAVCEPSSDGNFPKLDLHLLRRTLESVFHAVTGGAAAAKQGEFARRIDLMLDRLGLDTVTGLRDFLMRRSEPEDTAVVLEAEKQERPTAPYHHLQVCSRALLLLRLATGSCGRALRSSGIRAGEIEFWWADVGARRGLWNRDEKPRVLSDQWSDINPQLDSLAEFLSTNADPTFADLRRNHADVASSLGEFERVCFWGLGI